MESEFPTFLRRDLGNRRVAQATIIAISRSLAARGLLGRALAGQSIVRLTRGAIGHGSIDRLCLSAGNVSVADGESGSRAITSGSPGTGSPGGVDGLGIPVVGDGI